MALSNEEQRLLREVEEAVKTQEQMEERIYARVSKRKKAAKSNNWFNQHSLGLALFSTASIFAGCMAHVFGVTAVVYGLTGVSGIATIILLVMVMD